MPWCALRLVFLASNSFHNLRGQKLLCLCYHARHLQQIHRSKLLFGVYGFTANLSLATLDICQMLMRYLQFFKFEVDHSSTLCMLAKAVPPISVKEPVDLDPG